MTKKIVLILLSMGSVFVLYLFSCNINSNQQHLLASQEESRKHTCAVDSPTDDNYKRRLTVVQLHELAAEIRVAYRLRGMFPCQEGNLRSNLTAAGVCKKAGPLNTPIEDVWGTPIKYSVKGTTAVLSSAGLDRKFGTQDDVANAIIVCDGTNTVWGVSESGITSSLNR